MTGSSDKPSSRAFLPRYWPTWAGIALLWLVTRLPFTVQTALGRWLGRLLLRLGGRRVDIARTNIGLCFPELTQAQRDHMLRANYESMGIGIFEMGMSWWSSAHRLKKLVRIEGMENLQQALQAGNGAILLSAHFTTMEIGGRLLSMFVPFQVLYRQHKNAAMEYVISRGRNKFTDRAILRDNLLGMRRSLRRNIPVWYAPDQDFGIGKGIFSPFFGIPAATITATSSLARMANSPVVPYVQTRLPGRQGYLLKLYPALDDFPGDDVETDTHRINAFLEARIREQPEQYLWAHRRFKTRPENMPKLY